MQNDQTETSVIVSLRELVSLEDERIAEEEEARQRARAQAAEARKHAIEQAEVAEEARRLAEEEARLARAKQQAEEQARLAAIAGAELERARVEAQAVAAQAARDTELAHERALARHENERQKTRLKLWGVGVLLAAVLGAGGLGLMALMPTETADDPRIAQLERAQAELLRDRRAALDALHDRLEDKLGRYEGADMDAANRAAIAARDALDQDGATDAELDTYEAALDDLATEVGRAHRLAVYSTLRATHDALAEKVEATRRPTPALGKAAKAAETKRDDVDAAEPVERDLEAYDAALEQLALAVAEQPKPEPYAGRAAGTRGESETTEPVCTDYHDPLCARLTRD